MNYEDDELTRGQRRRAAEKRAAKKQAAEKTAGRRTEETARRTDVREPQDGTREPQDGARETGKAVRNGGRQTERSKTAQSRSTQAEQSLRPERSSRAASGRREAGPGDLSRGDSVHEALVRARAAKKKKKRILTWVLMAVVECLTIACICGYAYVNRQINLVQRDTFNESNVQNQELTVEDMSKMEGYWLIAVFGVDSRNSNLGKGSNSDVNIIACINRGTGEVKLVSVYRDTYLNISDKNSYRKINAAYANGGPEQALKALNKNLDLNITDYITFNWAAVATGINILGGVDVEITKPEFKYINSFITETVNSTGIGSYQLKSAGMNHLDGVQAVAYGRLRLMDTDYARTERQRRIIELAFEKAKKADYSVLNNILVDCLPQVMTNLTFADLTNVALSITRYHIGATEGFPYDKSDAILGKAGDVVVPQTLVSNVARLHGFLFGDTDYKPTSTVQTISNKIASDVRSGGSSSGSSSSGSSSSGSSSSGSSSSGSSSSEGSSSGSSSSGSSSSSSESKENGDSSSGTSQSSSETVPALPGGETGESSPAESGNSSPDRTESPSGSMTPGQNSTSDGPRFPGDTSYLNPGSTAAETTAEVKTIYGEDGKVIQTRNDQNSGPGATGPTAESESSRPVKPGDEPETTQAATPGSTSGSSQTPGSSVSTETTQALSPGSSVSSETTQALSPGSTPSTTGSASPGSSQSETSSSGPGSAQTETISAGPGM